MLSSKLFNFLVFSSVALLSSTNILCANSSDIGFKEVVKPFINKYCIDCHDSDIQKGDVSLHNITNITDMNSSIWKTIWEQVALKEMPPRKKKNQPTIMERHKVSEWITNNLPIALRDKGGFDTHKRPIKGNHLDHDLLFNKNLIGLEPSSTPARIWRISPQEFLVRLNELVNTEASYDPMRPGVRTRGDLVPMNINGEVKVYLGLQRYLGHLGGRVAYSAGVTGFPSPLSKVRDHGLRNYPFLYTVNSSQTSQIMGIAEQVLRFMAFGPDAKAYQFADKMRDIPEKYKPFLARGTPLTMYYTKEIKRPITPIYELMNRNEIDDELLTASINYLFESLTFRKPTKSETEEYFQIAKKTISDLGAEKGVPIALSTIFLESDALFRPELAAQGKPDKFGRVMLQGNELMLALNAAFSYIKPDKQLRTAFDKGILKTKEDVEREITRILNDDSIRKPKILEFFREYFDYDLCIEVCKDDKALEQAGGTSLKATHTTAMARFVKNTDRLVELIVQEDRNVLKKMLTTNRIIYSRNDDIYFRRTDNKRDFSLTKGTNFRKKKGETKEEFQVRKNLHVEQIEKEAEEIFIGAKKQIFVRDSHYDLNLGSQRHLASLKKSERMGILTHPSWLISHSDAMDNHAILRGRWIRERLLGDAVPDVPITVDAMLPDEPNKTLRHRMRVTREKDCWRCHQKMDPLGLPFEMYNHIGLIKDEDKGEAVDSSGEILFSGDPSLDGKVENALEMIEKLASSERVEQVFVRHVFRFWIGRNENLNDGPILQDAYKAYKNSNGSLKALLTSILTSDAFLYRKVLK